MEKYKVTPVNIRNGSKAPYYVISISSNQKKEEAINQAKSLSRLSSFDNWSFEIERV